MLFLAIGIPLLSILLRKEMLPERVDWIIRYYYGYITSKFIFPLLYPNHFEANEIIPNIWLGNLKSGVSFQELKKKNIKRIIMAILGGQPKYPDDFNYLVVPIRDITSENIAIYLDEAHDFIDEGIKNGESVLIHCVAGRSRSATIVISYLMKTLKMSYLEAYNSTKDKRSKVRVNEGFINVLKSLESKKNN